MYETLTWEEASTKTHHSRMAKRLPKKPLACPNCGKVKMIHLTNKDHLYSEDPNDWQYLCSQCHSDHDVLHNGKGNKNKSKFYEKFNALFETKLDETFEELED